MESAFRAIECQLAQMDVLSHYSLTFSADDCLFSLNEQQFAYHQDNCLGYCAWVSELKKGFLYTHIAFSGSAVLLHFLSSPFVL